MDLGVEETLVENLHLIESIRLLPDRQQAVLGLRYGGYTQQAIVELLGVSRTTVWADEAAALSTLRDKFRLEDIVESEVNYG